MTRTYSIVLFATAVGIVAGAVHAAVAAPLAPPHEEQVPAGEHAKAAPAPEEAGDAGGAVRWLLGGNATFTRTGRSDADLGQSRRSAISQAQHPVCTVLTCADSRVPPEHIFDAGLGDIFTVRVAGNVAEPATIASIEYSTEHLETPLVVVMGHERCGAVKAAMGNTSLGPNLDVLLDQIRPHIVGADDLDAAVRRNTEAQAQALLSSSILAERVHRGLLKIVPAIYDLDTGIVDFLAPATAER